MSDIDRLANQLTPFILRKIRQASGTGVGAGNVTLTNAQILQAVLSQDGPGSELDADTVDGLHGADLALVGHAHDSRYYTETESDALLAAKSPTTHHHDATYGRLGVNNTWSGVNRFAGDALGIAARLWDAGRGSIPLADHFRSGSIPVGYAWAGTPFVTAGAVDYAAWGDFLFTRPGGGSYNRSFLYKTIPNNAANWQNRIIMCRMHAGVWSEGGVRFDDGSDNNYAEVLCSGAAADGTQRLNFVSRVSGGSVVVAQSNLVVPLCNFMTFMLLSYWTGSGYMGIGYLVGEDTVGLNISGFDISFPGGVFPPAAGRIGVIVKDGAGESGPCAFDWFGQDFG